MNYFKLIFGVMIFLMPGLVSATTLENYIATYNPQQASQISYNIIQVSNKYQLDPLLVSSIYSIESKYNNNAVSSAGALGIAQLLPETAMEMGSDPYSIESNIEGGAKYFRMMVDLHANKGDEKYNYALASYNAGPGNVVDSIPSYTYGYIQDVNNEYLHQKSIITDISSTYSIKPIVGNNNSIETNPINSPTDKQRLLAKLQLLKKLYELKANMH